MSIFVYENGSFDNYSLDKEAADNSHYEFQAEQEIRKNCMFPEMRINIFMKF